jgi:hypothetical protein
MNTTTEGMTEEEIAEAERAARKPGRPRVAKPVTPSEKQKRYIARLRFGYAAQAAKRDGVDVLGIIRELYPDLVAKFIDEIHA